MRTKSPDKKLIILHALHELYEKNNETEIRRARLKELCEDRLNQVTGGSQDSYGGSFERYLKELEQVGAETIRHQKSKKFTLITSNIGHIEALLTGAKLNESLGKADKKIIDQNVEDSMFEELIENTYSLAIDKLANPKNNPTPGSHVILKEMISKVMANTLSRCFEFNISYNDQTDFLLDYNFITAIADPVVRMAQRNTKAPFKIMLEYKGMPRSPDEVRIRFEPVLLKMKVEYFIRWVKAAFNYDIQEDDKRKLKEGQYDLLNNPANEYYNIFNKSTSEYFSMLYSLGNDQINKLFTVNLSM
jgi:hypothetical protein